VRWIVEESDRIAVALCGFNLKKYKRSGDVNRCQRLIERRSLFVARY
jgi:hypothetical protein